MWRRRLLWLGSALIVGGASMFGYYFWVQYSADRAQCEARALLDRLIEAQRACQRRSQPAAHPGLRTGDVIGELTVPRLHLSVMVFEGATAGILKIGAGHIPVTALPGDSGNVGIAAHRDTYFRPLRLVRDHDTIVLKTSDGTLRYAVTSTQIVAPSDVDVLAKAPGRDLTLVTCYPFYCVGSAPKRFIVHARKLS
jgi:sortase A